MLRFGLILVTMVLICGLPLCGEDKKTDPVVGTYTWYTGAEMVIRQDGTATATLEGKKWAIRWVANPYGGYVLMYDTGGVDILKLSPDATKLEGTGVSEGKSYPVSGTKR